MDIQLQNLFYNDIKREINGVIKVDQDDEHNVYTELNEYVVTKESLKHIDTFFERYLKSTNTPTDKIGSWISGDFGSGKSHFLKILSYILENQEARGKTALEFLEEKIPDTSIFTTIEKSVKSGTKDVILFNIDSKAGETGERIVDILMRVFNEKRGYFGDVYWIAELEENLEDKGLFDSFKEEVLRINGNSWEEIRDQYSFEQDDIVEALSACGFQSKEAAENMFEADGQNYILTVEKFAKKVEKYCKSKGDNHQVIFLIDEIGQYIGDNSQLMLNLQTVAEELGTILKGKAWIIVTSQADIDTALKGIQEKGKRQDFSKIQARFDTRMSLSSANVDEVIKRRILRKKEVHTEMLSLYYDEKKIILKNLISFSQGSAEMKNYRATEDFVAVYPFVPYQFNVLQKVFERIRTTGFTGKHLAKGERSMLNAYKESAEKYGDSGIGALVPFYSFYDTIESFLDPIIIKTVRQADDNEHLQEFDCQIIKTLFMIRHVKEFQPNLDNIVVLSLTDIDEDKLKLREQVAASLNRLERETLISKSGDNFHFLTNEEQEINREIKGIDVEKHRIINEIYKEVFESNTICQKSYGDYKFNKAVDESLTPASGADLTIKFLTPYSDEYVRGSGQHSLSGDNLSNINSKDMLLFVLPDDDSVTSQIESYLQIDKYMKQNRSSQNDENMQKILFDKSHESQKLKDSSALGIVEGVRHARIFIDGVEATDIESGNPKDRVKKGYEKLIANVYNKSQYVTREFESESDIIRLLKSDDLERYGAGKSETNALALEEMLNYIFVKHERKQTLLLSEIREKFLKKPYGWKGMTISGLVATLFVGEEIKLRYQKTYLSKSPEEVTKYLTRKEHFDKVIIEVKKKTGAEIIQNVRAVLREIYDKIEIPEKENDLFELTRQVFSDEKDVLSKILGQYSAEKRYPGKPPIEAYHTFLQDCSSISDPTAFLQQVSDEMDELGRLHAEAMPAVRFFNGPQVKIFRRVLDKTGDYSRNSRFLSENARQSLARINEVIASPEPYADIKDLGRLESAIEASLADSLDNLKKEYLQEIESYKKTIQEVYLYHPDDYPKDIDTSVNAIFDSPLKKVEQSKDCSFVKLEIGAIPDIYKKASAFLDQNKIVSKPDDGDNGNEDKGIDDKKPKVKHTEVINKTSFFKTGDIIETEEDLDRYLTEIKSRLQEILKEKKVRVI